MADETSTRTRARRGPIGSGGAGRSARPAHRSAPALTPWVVLELIAPGLGRDRVLTWFAAAALISLAWISPVSPGALQWGDLALGLGRPDLAATHYDRVGRWSPFPTVQRRALMRAAMVTAVELGDGVRARRQLEWLARISPEAVQVADAKERIAALLVLERQPAEAARVLGEAHDACPDCPEAADRLVRASELLADAARLPGAPPEAAVAAAESFVEVVRRYPSERARANIGRAELLLSQGESLEALVLFEDAAAQATHADLQAVAQLGEATCLERLGSLDEALAELDDVALPVRVRASRVEGLKARLDEP